MLKLDSYKPRIKKITEILTHKFEQDVLLYFHQHTLKKYLYSQNKKFVFSENLPSSLQSEYKKNYVEFRFFCQTKKVTITQNKQQFFSHMLNKSKVAEFFMIPYCNDSEQEGIENFYKCCFEYEFNLKIYHNNKFKLKTISKNSDEFIRKIYKKIKDILSSEIPIEVRDEPMNKSGGIVNILPEKEIEHAISNVQEHMNKGDCYLANVTYTTGLAGGMFLTKSDFIDKWFNLKSRYGIFFDNKKIGLACFSPERFLLCKNNFLVSEPIKGTLACQGLRPMKKDALKLWKNKKEIYEHTLVVDLIRNDLNSVCVPGSVGVYQPFQANVAGKLLQMQSTVFGKKVLELNPGQCFSSLLPAGSVTGTPKKKVCELISRYEKNARGYYTGVCGILEPNGDFDSCVLIRSIYRGNLGTYLGVGAGITTLSKPKKEVEEFKQKLNSFFR